MANRGIAHDANGAHDQAVEAWEAASHYADAHLAGTDIDYWIKSGLGAALFETGAYERSIAVSELALDSFDQARRLAGDSILERLAPADRAFLLEG